MNDANSIIRYHPVIVEGRYRIVECDMREIEDEARKLGGYYPGGSYETKEQCQAAIDKDPTGKTFSF